MHGILGLRQMSLVRRFQEGPLQHTACRTVYIGYDFFSSLMMVKDIQVPNLRYQQRSGYTYLLVFIVVGTQSLSVFGLIVWFSRGVQLGPTTGGSQEEIDIEIRHFSGRIWCNKGKYRPRHWENEMAVDLRYFNGQSSKGRHRCILVDSNYG